MNYSIMKTLLNAAINHRVKNLHKHSKEYSQALLNLINALNEVLRFW